MSVAGALQAQPAREGGGIARRLLAGAVPTVLCSSLVVASASWLGRVPGARSSGEALVWWLQAWGAFAVWAALVTGPALLLFGWPLDRYLAGRRPLEAALWFAALGFAVGAVAGFAILTSIDAGWVGAAVVAPVGAMAAFAGRLLVEPLAARAGALGALTLATLVLLAVGVASP